MRKTMDTWCLLPTPLGLFRMYDSGDERVRIVCMGDIHELGSGLLLRVHSSCIASELFGALDCDCADQLRRAMHLIAVEGRGLIVHLHQEGRGQGLSKKIVAVGKMQREGLDTVEAFDALGLEQDSRGYDAAASVLRSLGIDEVRLISNNPRKARFLENRGVRVSMVHARSKIRKENLEYLRTKRLKLGHALALDSSGVDGEVIHFYHSDQPWGEFSNFSQHAVFLKGRIWPTAEHFYQAQKFADMPDEEEIRRCPSPMLAKRSAAGRKEHRRSNWPDIKKQIMLDVLRAKFTQHPDLEALLLESGDRTLVEHTEQDSFWGDGGDGSGRNRLGCLLMQVRQELRQGRNLGGRAMDRSARCAE